MPRTRPEHTPRALFRVRPLAFETNASFIGRLAGAHHLTVQELLGSLRIYRPKLYPREDRLGPHSVTELYLNAAARERISQYTGIPGEHLARALPCWKDHEGSRGRRPTAGARPGGAWRPSDLPAVIGCPHCTIARTGTTQPVWRYLPHDRLVCGRHRTWALGPHTLQGVPVTHTHVLLHGALEIVQARYAHQRLVRRWGPDADDVIAQAARITEHWRRHAPPTERLWSERAERLAPRDTHDPLLWSVLAREAITYPETIALARLFEHRPTARYLRTRPGQSHPLHAVIAELLEQPWLKDPAHYPEDLSRFIGPAPRDRHSQRAYRHHTARMSSTPCTAELTELGYQPRPMVRRSASNG
ncbi:TniQ family protein [Streptomyces sp. NPDC050264]|uniref:TniQ family protein n=1 Tax=Streptomyces sp. NPDC050264 TaxID=3155038 RepID=UPI00341C9B67